MPEQCSAAYLEQTNVYNGIDLTKTMYQLTPPYGIQAPVAVVTRVPSFICPSDKAESVCSNAYAITGDFAPSNYAFCLGTGTSTGRTGWRGSPWDADGVFFAQSKVKITDIKDGSSNTIGVSERLLGEGAESTTLTSRAALNPQTMVVNPSAETNDANCGSSLRINFSQRRMYTWVAGEPRCTSYNHYYAPNDKRKPDCVANFTGSDPVTRSSGHGLSTARSRHTGGVTAGYCDGMILRNVFCAKAVNSLGADADRIVRDCSELIDQKNMRVRFKLHVETEQPIFEVLDPIADLSTIAKEVTQDERDILHDIYGEPACLFKEKLIYKPAGAIGATLHQDWIVWPGFPESFLTVLVAIDCFSEESGATEVYPGLHKRRYLSPRDGQHHSLVHELLGVEPVPLILEPGDVAVFGCFTPHRSAANTSKSSRRGYFISYNALSDGGDQYQNHYREFHEWIRGKSPVETRDQLFFR